MKTKQYLAMMFAATALFACNNDDAPKPEEMGEAGKAWASFSISIPKSSMTKAADAANATADEILIKEVTLYQEGKGVGSPAKELVTLNVSEFTPDATNNTYLAKAAVEVTGTANGTATCNIFAVINKTTDITAANITTNGSNPLTITGVDKLKDATTGFVMSSKTVAAIMYADKAAAEAAAAASATEVKVERAVSKVLVKTILTTTGTVEDLKKSGNFTGSSIMWLIGNSNKKFNVILDKLKLDINDFGQDPNYATVTNTDFTALAGEYEQLTAPNYAMKVADNTATAITSGAVQYCVENNNETYQVGNTSYVSVTAEFTPTLIVIDTDIDGATNAITDPTTAGTAQTTFFYHVTKQLYFDQAAYTKYTTTTPGAVTEFYGPYTDGKCYYHVPIGSGINNLQTAVLGVKRNHLYTLTINSLTAPGNPLPTTQEPTDPGITEPDPTDPIVPNAAWIAVKLDVEAWSPVSMGAVDLE